MYVQSVSDFVVLKDACVLIINECSTFIMKLLTNGRLVKFANIGRPDRNPYCFCVSEDDLIVVHLLTTAGSVKYGYTNYVFWMNTDGIVIDQASFSKHAYQQPCIIQIFESHLCVLYNVDRTCFRGIYEFDVSRHFQSLGMFVDEMGNVMISDFCHQSVFMLDKE